jgi:hypothetical protein
VDDETGELLTKQPKNKDSIKKSSNAIAISSRPIPAMENSVKLGASTNTKDIPTQLPHAPSACVGTFYSSIKTTISQ